jgi:receptor-type tyrosine-protein phosphatase N
LNTNINFYDFSFSSDFAFGKCLPQYGLEPEDLFREPLEEPQTRLLATMLEELQGAGLDWQHIYTQCRMQGALYALKTKSKMPNNLCANLAPDPEVLDAQSPMAFVRFTPPNSEFADEVYYPPLKRAFNDMYADENDQFLSLKFF